jgi:hypothetical protein
LAIALRPSPMCWGKTNRIHIVLERKLQELYLAHEYQMKRQEEKEAARQAREDQREQNARAGYIYVISNIGAFGEGIYKIGMTRRLEPMDRVDELGDASVPFRFDVHALVFSDDAPTLEAKLHSHFDVGRLNKVNGRKEFFRADLKEIEAVIRANYDAVVQVVHAAPAEQYRESLRLAIPLESMQTSERIALGENARHEVQSA